MRSPTNGKRSLAFAVLLVLLCVAAIYLTLTTPPAPTGFGLKSPASALAPLSAEERQWIGNHPAVTFCPDPDYPPFEFFDESGGYTGISADYLALIAERTGLTLVLHREPGFGACVEKVKAGEADMLSTVFTSDLRREYLNYSDAFYQPPMVFITRRSVEPGLTMADLEGMSVAVVEGYTTHELLRQKYPGIVVQPVQSISAGLRKVSLGMADAFFNDLATSTYYVEKEGLTNLHIAGEYRPEEPRQFRLAFGIRNDEPVLRDILNKGLQTVSPAERDRIAKKWISSSLSPSFLDSRAMTAIVGGFAVLLMVIAGVLLWNRSLRIAVAEKTRHLSEELEERRKAEKALRESEEKYRSIITNIQDVYYRSDCEGRLIMASPSWATLLGYGSVEECLMQDIAEKFYREPELRKAFVETVRREGSVIDYEVVLKKKDGTPLHVSTNSHLFFDEAGTVLGIEGIFRDITERKQAEENLKRTSAELRAAYDRMTKTEGEMRRNYDELSRVQQALTLARKKLNLLNSVTFQDLRSAAFSLIGYLQLEREGDFRKDNHGYLTQEWDTARKISDVLDFAKTYQDLGISPPKWQNVNQTFLFAISHLDLSNIARKADVGDLEIFADPLLERVFFNLAENVLVHGGNATEISLTCEVTKEGLKIHFSDNGRGVQPSEKERIFMTGYGNRKGMGLFLAREILSITGITLRETGTEGSGAQFEFFVPKGGYRFGQQRAG